jgi:hypothetical protein
VDQCEGFVRDLLGDGPVFSDEAERRSQEQGYSNATFRRACDNLGVKREKEKRFDGRWRIYFPPGENAQADARESDGMSNFGDEGTGRDTDHEGAQTPHEDAQAAQQPKMSIFDETQGDVCSVEDAQSHEPLSNFADGGKTPGFTEGAHDKNGMSNFAAEPVATPPAHEGAQNPGTEHLEHLRAPDAPGGYQEGDL